jgi:hypothetical protein
MSTAAAFCGVLFEQPQGRTKRDAPPIFSTLNVGQVMTAVAADWVSCGLPHAVFRIRPMMSGRCHTSKAGSALGPV